MGVASATALGHGVAPWGRELSRWKHPFPMPNGTSESWDGLGEGALKKGLPGEPLECAFDGLVSGKHGRQMLTAITRHL